MLYAVVLEAGGGQTLLVLGIGDGAYFFGLSFPATFASQACFMELALAILSESTDPPSVLVLVVVEGEEMGGLGCTSWGGGVLLGI